MELNGARVLVVGASGVLGGGLARALSQEGARVVVTARDTTAVAELADSLGTEPLALDLVDTDACAAVVDAAAAAFGGLDVLVVATGVAAFGPAMDTDAAVVEELFAVDTLGPMALVRSASRHLAETPGGGGVAVVLSAILADLPTNQMADYSATKAALSAWLGVVRRENRRRFRVLDVRPPHLDTGLSERALAGVPPKLPEPLPATAVVEAVLGAMRDDASEIVWDPKERALVSR